MTTILILLVFIAFTAYSYFGFHSSLKASHRKLLRVFGLLLALIIIGNLFIWHRQLTNYGNTSIGLNLLIGLFTTLFLTLLISLIIFLAEDIVRFFIWIARSFTKKKNYPKRVRATAQTALALGTFTLILVFYGVLIGFTHYKVHRVVFEHENIPKEFDGFTIAQLSDMHLGTFGSVKQVEKGIEMLQHETFDMLVFTGDLVNNVSAEAVPYIDLLKSIKAPYGKYAVLGNHDYAHYAGRLTPHEQEDDLEQLRTYLAAMNFIVLENRHENIHRGHKHIVLAGVENWGIAPFPQYGDLEKALTGINDTDFVLLLSHDPSHWSKQVLNFPVQIELTLSGHTHGMQLGIELNNFKWSPVQYRYPNWSGMHREQNQFLYVNRGFGGIGFPGRIGIRPEITIIELRSK